MRKQKRVSRALAVITVFFMVFPFSGFAGSVAPILSLLLGDRMPGQTTGGAVAPKVTPALSHMTTRDTGTIEIAWTAGSDGITPEEEIRYEVHLSTREDFTPGPDTLKKTVVGETSTEISGLEPDTLYYGKVVAVYPTGEEAVSTTLKAKTALHDVVPDDTAVVVTADELGLGPHTTSDGSTYVYSGGTPPPADSLLFSEDAEGVTSLRVVVDAATNDDGTITVQTRPGSLTDVLDRGSLYSSFHLTKDAAQSERLAVRAAGVRRPRAEEDGPLSLAVTAEFEPEVIATAQWGATTAKQLDSAEIGLTGTLSLDVLATYSFPEPTEETRDFTLFRRSWNSTYMVGSVPVYQEIILTMDVAATVTVDERLSGTGSAHLTETVEMGVRFDGGVWSPYILRNGADTDSIDMELETPGPARAGVRLIPRIEVRFYDVEAATLTMEPVVTGMLTETGITTNEDFLAAHPGLQTQIDNITVDRGLESGIEVDLQSLGNGWETLARTCILGRESDCLEVFEPEPLFSLPVSVLQTTTSTDSGSTELVLEITDGTANGFVPTSIRWEVFPADGATVSPGVCSGSSGPTRCEALFTPGFQEEYTVFVSGYGRLGEVARRFQSVSVAGVPVAGGGAPGPEPTAPAGTVVTPPVTATGASLTWQRSDNGHGYTREGARAYCENLVQDGYSDWRLPTLDELKSLVVCSNGQPTPLQTYPYPPYQCHGNGYSRFYNRPTIDPAFTSQSGSYWTDTDYDSGHGWAVFFSTGMTGWYKNTGYSYVRCVR